MSRLYVRAIGNGVPVTVQQVGVPNSFITLAEARDFSILDENARFPGRDPLDASRAILPGQIEFLSDMLVTNIDTVPRWIDIWTTLENGLEMRLPGRFRVDAGMTEIVPMRGRGLLRQNPLGTAGMRLRARAEVSGVFHVWLTGLESAAPAHDERWNNA